MTDSSVHYPRSRAAIDVIGTTKPALTAATVDGFYLVVGKRLLDILLVLLLAPLALPLILLASLALWIEGGNPFYHQDRLGRHGERFRIYKLRTMVRNADKMLETCLAKDPELRAEWDATQKLKKDPRITRIGALLRKTSLDELPQLWNVLTGEMSLIGPRPMLPEQLPLYGDASYYFALRPGITGSWQVSARNEDLFTQRVGMDQSYAEDLSPWRDMVILFKTVGVVLRRTGY
ncbi:sugar transferase [Roseovarius sp.]|uniref:sugar transferase n=1 Tax=Roseovarius sp. TaxID=1486281 RepID=UPI000C373730|nr:sugar transferase [Roseovarius sp.]MAZ20656.1 sugar transferase [Roseovarius sp.]|tara:strand:- start:719 stop:1420 length:702 start_codon:yes stop_codon:yes gene_type:complete